MIHAYLEKVRDIMSYLQWWEFTFFGLVVIWVSWIVFDAPTMFQYLGMILSKVGMTAKQYWSRLRGSRD